MNTKNCNISETVQGYYDGLTGSRIYVLSIGTKINDLGWSWPAETHSCGKK